MPNSKQKQSSKKLKIRVLKKGIYTINGWPDAIKTFDLGESAKNKALKTLIISCDTNYFPTSEEHNRIRDLSSLGIKIYWENLIQGKLLFHYNGLFMAKELVSKFKKSEKLNISTAIYISAKELNDKEKEAISNAIEGYRKFSDGFGVVCTGGGGGGMEYCNQITQEKSLISVGVCWNDNAEPQNKYLDVVSRFANKDLFARQDMIDKFAKIIIAGPGGFGTDLELALTNVNTKLEEYSNRPVILICKKSYTKYLERINDIIERNRAGDNGKKILKNTYLSEDGKDVYKILCNHFKLN